MRLGNNHVSKVFNRETICFKINQWRLLNKKIAFTNGVFDILHQGHIASLTEAASYGDVLIVGVNSDASVKRLKGETRPVNDENSRILLLSSLLMTDAVILFEEDTPLELIKLIMPDVIVKGGDYTVEQIAGAKEVLANGGEVKIVPIVEGFSTTGIIEKMKK
jgi:D-beta-D-heptose 7-phosphate kinase/D-beta-D-heptose 1-phosphate adenosyltransferase